MRRWDLRVAVMATGLGLLVGAGPAGAAQYNVIATAGNNGDSHGGDNDDPDAFATFMRTEGSAFESYEASANTNGGLLFASAARQGALPAAAITTRAVARIEETIFITEVPSGPITIHATLGAGVSATATAGFGGIARAMATLNLDGGTGSCQVFLRAHNVDGYQDLSGCSAPDSSASGGTVHLTLTPQQLAARNYQVDIDVQLEAGFEGVGQISEASAAAGGGVSPLSAGLAPRGGGPEPGIVSIDFDPPIAHAYFGGMTSFPVLAPEPGGPLLLAVGSAALCAARRRRHAS